MCSQSPRHYASIGQDTLVRARRTRGESGQRHIGIPVFRHEMGMISMGDFRVFAVAEGIQHLPHNQNQY